MRVPHRSRQSHYTRVCQLLSYPRSKSDRITLSLSLSFALHLPQSPCRSLSLEDCWQNGVIIPHIDEQRIANCCFNSRNFARRKFVQKWIIFSLEYQGSLRYTFVNASFSLVLSLSLSLFLSLLFLSRSGYFWLDPFKLFPFSRAKRLRVEEAQDPSEDKM